MVAEDERVDAFAFAQRIYACAKLIYSAGGAPLVARTLRNWLRTGRAHGHLEPAVVNGQPGALLIDHDGGLISVMALEIAGGQIRSISSVVNPEKIGHIRRTGDMRALLARRRRTTLRHCPR